MCFDSVGTNVWVGDSSGSISAFQFDIFTLKLNKTRKVILFVCQISTISTLYYFECTFLIMIKVINNPGYSITSLSHRQLNAKESVLLVNAMPNYLLLYKMVNKSPTYIYISYIYVASLYVVIYTYILYRL